jgi:hypothetical protein
MFKILKNGDSIMNKKWIAVIGTGTIIAGLAIAAASFAVLDSPEFGKGTIRLEQQAEADFPSLAKITLSQAVQTALGAVNGKVLKAELEDENGFLVYGVEVVTADKSIVEVKVDAGSEKVLAMSRDRDDEQSDQLGNQEDQDSEGHDSEQEHEN